MVFTSTGIAGEIDRDTPTKAARESVAWLLAHQSEFSTHEATVALRHIYRTTSDLELLAKLEGAVRVQAAFEPVSFEKLKSARTLTWRQVKPAVTELFQNSCATTTAPKKLFSEVQALVSRHEEHLFSSAMGPAEVLMATRIAKRAGLALKKTFEATVAETKLHISKLLGHSPSSVPSIYDLYAATHLVLADADMFDHYVKASDHENEIEFLRRGLKALWQATPNDGTTLDIAFETIVAFRLARVPLNVFEEKLRGELLKRQNADGSFGPETHCMKCRLHHTALAVLALTEFAPVFRGQDSYCDAKWK